MSFEIVLLIVCPVAFLLGLVVSFLFRRCKHEYKVIDRYTRVWCHPDEVLGMRYVSRCDKCGKIKTKDI